ncbi:MAG: hypothetical protein V3574_03710 [Candidatus Moraniibacteriota bacterium]
MKIKLPSNIQRFIKESLPDLLKTEKKVYLKKPFAGFFIDFNRKDDFLEKYSLIELGIFNDPRDIFLYCDNILGKKKE